MRHGAHGFLKNQNQRLWYTDFTDWTDFFGCFYDDFRVFRPIRVQKTVLSSFLEKAVAWRKGIQFLVTLRLALITPDSFALRSSIWERDKWCVVSLCIKSFKLIHPAPSQSAQDQHSKKRSPSRPPGTAGKEYEISKRFPRRRKEGQNKRQGSAGNITGTTVLL